MKQKPMLPLAGLLLLFSQAEAFAPPSCLLPSLARNGKTVISLKMQNEEIAKMDLTRRSALTLSSAALLSLGLAPEKADAFQAPPGVVIGNTPNSPQEIAGYVQHAVIRCKDIDDEVAFWTQGLGMKRLRSRGENTVFVGYGPESLKRNGGHFALELVEEDRKAPRLDIGTGFQRFEVELPQTLDQVLKIEEAGGSLLPRWFGTSNFFEAVSPSGWVVRVTPVKKEKVAYPFKAVVLRTKDVELSEYFFSTLGMSQSNGFTLPFLGDGSSTLRYSTDAGPAGAAVVLEPLPKEVKEISPGNAFKLALLTDNVKGAAEKVKKDCEAKILFQGKVPNVGTQVAALEEPYNGYTVVMVDYKDFEKELPKPPPTPPPAPNGKAATQGAAPPAESADVQVEVAAPAPKKKGFLGF